MVLVEALGVLCVAVGAYALARPMSIRTYPTGDEWKENPDRAEQEQRAYASMTAFFVILTGLVLLVGGLLGMIP